MPATKPKPAAPTPGRRRLRVVDEPAARPASPDYPYLRCRSQGHRWSDPYIDQVKDREYRIRGGAGRKITCDCEVCPTRKHGVMDWLGNIYRGWTFDYPDDYRWSSAEPASKADWRLAYTRSLGIQIRKPR